MKVRLATLAGRATMPLWSNRFYGLFHGPRFLRSFSAWLLPYWGYFYKWSDPE